MESISFSSFIVFYIICGSVGSSSPKATCPHEQDVRDATTGIRAGRASTERTGKPATELEAGRNGGDYSRGCTGSFRDLKRENKSFCCFQK